MMMAVNLGVDSFSFEGSSGWAPGGGGNRTSATVLTSTLGDADPASKAPKMLP